MGIESANTIWGLNAANPVSSDLRSEGDNHLRLLKSALLGSFITDVEANRPAAGTEKRLFFASDTKKVYRDNGSTWDEISEVSGLGVTGTRLLFQQTAAPTGWTKVTVDIDNHGLRVTTGTVGSGGTVGFTDALNASIDVSGTAISIAQMPSHSHNNLMVRDSGPNTARVRTGDAGSTLFPSASMSSSGGGETHDHNFNLDVQYLDVIVAEKD